MKAEIEADIEISKLMNRKSLAGDSVIAKYVFDNSKELVNDFSKGKDEQYDPKDMLNSYEEKAITKMRVLNENDNERRLKMVPKLAA